MNNYTDEEIKDFEKQSKDRDIKDENWEMYENAEDFLEKEEEHKQLLLSLIREKSEISSQELIELSKLSAKEVDFLIHDLNQEQKIITKYAISPELV